MAFFSWLKRRRRVPSLGREWVAGYVDERGPVVFVEGAVPGWDASALIETSPSPVVCGRPVRGGWFPKQFLPRKRLFGRGWEPARTRPRQGGD